MKEKEQGIDLYPNVILSDCIITKIYLNGADIEVEFSDYGFVKKANNEKYYRTDGAKIVIEGFDADSVSIKEIRAQQLSEELFFESMYDIKARTFFENINLGVWKFEIVEEFYSTGGGIYIGQIWNGKTPFWCGIRIQYKRLRYLWDSIRYDCPFD